VKRFWTLAAVLSLAALACTESADIPPTTGQAVGSTSTTTTSLPTSTTSTIPPIGIPGLPNPELPDPVDVAEQGWGEIAGFASSDLDESELSMLNFRLGSFLGTAIGGYSYTGLESDDGGGKVIGLSMSPAISLQGDPFLAPGLAGSIGGPFDELEEITIDTAVAYRIFLSDDWWYFWASNTHLYATVGAEPEVEDAMAAIIDGAPDAYLWQTGDCLWFGVGEETGMPYSPFGEAHLVDCSSPHTHEVIHSLVTDHGPDADHPGETFATEVERTCGRAYRNYTGIDWSDSKVTAIRYLPDLHEWDEGDRYVACVAELSAPQGGALRIEGTLEGIGDDALIARTPGDCYAVSWHADPVDCRLTHTTQFVGFLEDPTPADTAYPGAAELLERFLSACTTQVEDFASVTDLNGARVTAQVVPTSVVEWEDDIRTYRCFAAAVNDDGAPLEVSGSFDDTWEIVRFSEDDVTA